MMGRLVGIVSVFLGLFCAVQSQGASGNVPKELEDRFSEDWLQRIVQFRRGWTKPVFSAGEDPHHSPPIWAEWSPCSSACGPGQTVRFQSDCIGSNCVDIRPCNNGVCGPSRRNPPMSDWSVWSTCTSSCGSGARMRTRGSCSINCVQTERCNSQACPEIARGRKAKNGFPTENQQRWWDTVSASVSRKRRKRNHAWWDRVRIRREYRMLTSAERLNLHNGMWAMKNTLVDGLSQFDIFVQFHQNDNSPSAHFGAGFYPWHREFLFRFEIILQRHCPRCTLPYWDSRLDSGLPSPKDSVMWSTSFMGTGVGPVSNGPFAGWTPIPRCLQAGSATLVRGSANVQPNALFLDADFTEANAKRSYRDLVVPPTFEWKHGSIHIFVGGHMEDIQCSPTDPVFWLHHSFVDCFWLNHRQNFQTTDITTEYPDGTNGDDIGGPNHAPNSNMSPFRGFWNINGLDTFYTDFYYTCEAFRVTCVRDSDCGSIHLWCHNGRCKCKIRRQGNCRGLPRTSSPCSQGSCNGNVCQ